MPGCSSKTYPSGVLYVPSLLKRAVVIMLAVTVTVDVVVEVAYDVVTIVLVDVAVKIARF